MLSQKARYALRALITLAEAGEGASMMTGDLATAAAVPRAFLERILLDLKKHGLVVSRRGRAGGYGLAKPPGEIDFAVIVRAIDGPLALAPCASKTAFRRCEDCADVETCAIRKALIAVRDATAAILEGRNLAGGVA
jgi:Rrf2 family protein